MLSLFQKKVTTCKSIFSFSKTVAKRAKIMVELNVRCIRNVFNDWRTSATMVSVLILSSL